MWYNSYSYRNAEFIIEYKNKASITFFLYFAGATKVNFFFPIKQKDERILQKFVGQQFFICQWKNIFVREELQSFKICEMKNE